MIRHQVTFYDLTASLFCQLVKYFTQVPSKLPKDPLLAPLWDVHHVILAIPTSVGVAKALILFHRGSLSLGRDHRFTTTNI